VDGSSAGKSIDPGDTRQYRVIPAQLTLLAGSIATLVGYTLLWGSPAWALPLTTLLAVTVTTGLAWRFYHHEDNLLELPRFTDPMPQTSPDLGPLIRALLALSAAAGLVHLQTLIERAALNFLETGTITALAVAGRGWDALAKVITAASVLPVFPRWADHHARADYQQNRTLLRWSLRRTAALSLFVASLIGIGAWRFGPWLDVSRGWESGGQAAQMALILLPRFVLVTCIQPLVLQHYAAGTPWYPVVGSAAGIGVLAAGAAVIVPRYKLPGFALVTALSVIPGWLMLGWIAWRREE
jgi:peptidoglycan biosynthesis protein MviN/MurJ (putative lipid II flippase)